MSIDDEKKACIDACLSIGRIRVRVATDEKGLVLPPHLMTEHYQYLYLSRRFRGSMQLLDDGIHAELSFREQMFLVVLPWESIKEVQDANGNRFVFHAMVQISDALRALAESIKAQSGTPARTLEGIEGGGELTPPRTGHLKLVS